MLIFFADLVESEASKGCPASNIAVVSSFAVHQFGDGIAEDCVLGAALKLTPVSAEPFAAGSDYVCPSSEAVAVCRHYHQLPVMAT